jgi:aquaporin Z
VPLTRRLAAEFVGTFWLVLGGCGAAVLAAGFPGVGIGFAGVALAFGLTVLTMAYALGHISGGHFNPAVTLGLTIAKRADPRDLLPYAVVQVAAAVTASGILYVIANGTPGFSVEQSGFAANGYGAHSPGGYDLTSALVGPLAIGLGLTLIHLVSIPVTNTSVNPARSTGPALFVGDWALSQLWLFWLAPLAGAVVAAVLYPLVTGSAGAEPIAEEGQEPSAATRSAGDVPKL